MIHQRYFRPGQKVLIRPSGKAGHEGHTHLLSSYLQGGGEDYFDLALPYGSESASQYPFYPQMPMELSSDTLGLGARVNGRFRESISGNCIRVDIHHDLQMFQRRAKPRVDCRLGIRFTRGRGTLQKMRETWEKNVNLLRGDNATPKLTGFNECKINLSSGGIRFAIRPPAEPADLCLLLINLDDDQPPICALAEIIWSIPDQQGTVLLTGMQFIDILEQDQQRIDRFVARHHA